MWLRNYLLDLLLIEAILFGILWLGTLLEWCHAKINAKITSNPELARVTRPAWIMLFCIGFTFYHFPVILYLTRRPGKESASVWLIMLLTFIAYGVLGFGFGLLTRGWPF